MTATSMHRRKYTGSDPGRKTVGWIVVVVFHLIVLWALVTGTARKGLELIKKPMEAAVIQEVIIPPPPPPPPPPPKEIQKPQVPRPEAPPPPPFVPPPEVAPPTTTAPVIQSVPTPPPAPPVIAPPAPPAPAPAPSRGDIQVACPQQVKPEMPRQALREGVGGRVVAQATIRNGRVVDVQILSGPRVFHNAVRTAMMQYQCESNAGEITAVQPFDFKLE
jgi:protein TonB